MASARTAAGLVPISWFDPAFVPLAAGGVTVDKTGGGKAHAGSGGPSSSRTRPIRVWAVQPDWDVHINSGQQANFEAKFDIVIGHYGTPQWDFYKTWDMANFGYLNAFGQDGAGVPPTPVYQNDSDAAALYLPFAMNPDGTFPRRSVDLRSSTYRSAWAAHARTILDGGGDGIFVDDVNLNTTQMFVRQGGGAPLTDFTSGTYYTSPINGAVGFAALMGDFLHDVIAQVRTTHPWAKFIFNTQVFFLEPARWTDARTTRMIDACDWILIEHGMADTAYHSGPGTDTGSGDYPLRSVWKFIDAIHARGKAYIVFSRGNNRAIRKFEMANYLLTRDYARPDAIAVQSTADAASWPALDPIYDYDLGDRLTVHDFGSGQRVMGRFRDGIVDVTPGDRLSAIITTDTERETELAADSPTAWWKLNDSSGPADDAVGALDAAVTGSPVFDGRRVRFPTSSDYLTVTSAPAVAFGDHDWTLEFELTAPNPLPAAPDFPNIISKGWASIGGWYVYYHAGNQVLNFYGTTELGTNVPLGAGETALIAFTYEAATDSLRAYKNGQLVGTPFTMAGLTGTSDPLRINGGNQGGAPAGWTFGSVSLKTSRLTEQRLRAHYVGAPTPEYVNKAGGGSALARTGGTKAPAIVKAGGAVATARAGGAKAVLRLVAKTGGALAVAKTGGAKVSVRTLSGGARAAALGGGSRAPSRAVAGGASATARAGGSKVADFIGVSDKTGGASASMSAAGSRKVTRSATGGALASARAGGAKIAARVTTGGAVAQARTGGAKTLLRSKAGGAVSTALAGGSSVRASVVTKTGGGIIGEAGGGSSYIDGVRADTPAAYWPMNDLGFTQLEDNGGPFMALNGTDRGQPGATPELGLAVSFDGIGDYGRVSSLDLTATNRVTVECWLKWDAYANDDDLALEFGETNQPGGFWLNPNDSTGRFGAAMMYPWEQDGIARPSAATWHHLVVLFDRGASPGLSTVTVEFYVDGVFVADVFESSADLTGSNFGNHPLMVMGRSAPGDGTKSLLGAGDMQHLAIYSYALSPTRIAAHYDARSGTGSSGKGAVGGGSKLVDFGGNANKAGGGNASARAGGSKLAQTTRVGGGVALARAGGAKLAQAVKTGGAAVAQARAGGSKLSAITKAGGAVIAQMRAGGSKVAAQVATKAGGAAVTQARAGGSKVADFATQDVHKTGGAVATVSTASGVRAVLASKLGGGSALARTGGAKLAQAVRSGGAATTARAGGSKLSVAIKAAGAIAQARTGGIQTYGNQSDKAGGGVALASAAGTRNVESRKAGGAVATARAGGGKASAILRAGGALAQARAGGGKVEVITRAGGASSRGVAGGTKQTIKRTTGGASIAASAGGGADTGIVFDRAGGAVSQARAGGSQSFLRAFIVAGGGTCQARAGGAKASARVASGGGFATALTGGVVKRDRRGSGGGSCEASAGGTSRVDRRASGGGRIAGAAGSPTSLVRSSSGGARCALSAGGSWSYLVERDGGALATLRGGGTQAVTFIPYIAGAARATLLVSRRRATITTPVRKARLLL